jgi:hypothetical protein
MQNGGSGLKVDGAALPNSVDEVLDQIEAQQAIELAPDATPLDFLTAVYRDTRQPMQRRLRAAAEAAPYVHPKLMATAHVDGKDFASLLDARIAQLSEAKPLAVESKPTTDATLKPMVPDRRFRR